MSKLKVMQFKSYCPDKQTDRHKLYASIFVVMFALHALFQAGNCTLRSKLHTRSLPCPL